MANADFSLGEWRRVADGIYTAVAEPEAVTVGLIVGDTAALVVDTGSSPQQGAWIRAAVQHITDRPLAGVVVTHAHFDHAFGIAGFADLDSIGHESVAADLAGDVAARKAVELGLDPGMLQAPTRPLAVADAVELGGDRVAEIVHLGPAHSPGDLVISVSNADVVFAGDLIETAGPPWFGADSDPDQWPWAVHQLATLAGPQTRIIPGHGEPIDRESALGHRDGLDAVRTEIERLFEAGVAEGDAPEAGDWPFPTERVAAGITPGYAHLRSTAQTGKKSSGTDADGRTTLPLA